MKEETEYAKLENWFSQLEPILNPNFLMAFRKQLTACYEGNKKDAYKAAKISDEALQIEELLKGYKAQVAQHGTDDNLDSFFRKSLYKKLVQIIK